MLTSFLAVISATSADIRRFCMEFNSAARARNQKESLAAQGWIKNTAAQSDCTKLTTLVYQPISTYLSIPDFIIQLALTSRRAYYGFKYRGQGVYISHYYIPALDKSFWIDFLGDNNIYCTFLSDRWNKRASTVQQKTHHSTHRYLAVATHSPLANASIPHTAMTGRGLQKSRVSTTWLTQS